MLWWKGAIGGQVLFVAVQGWFQGVEANKSTANSIQRRRAMMARLIEHARMVDGGKKRSDKQDTTSTGGLLYKSTAHSRGRKCFKSHSNSIGNSAPPAVSSINTVNDRSTGLVLPYQYSLSTNLHTKACRRNEVLLFLASGTAPTHRNQRQRLIDPRSRF